MTVRTYGKLPYPVAVLGAAEVMRDQRILYVWLRPQASLERLSGVPQVCERRRRPTEVATHCRPSDPLCQPEVGGRLFFLRRRGHTDEISVLRQVGPTDNVHLNSRGISPLPSQANSVLTNAACRYHVVQGAFLQRLGLRTWFLDCAAYFQVPEPARSRIVRRPVSQSSLQAWRASDVSEI